MKAVQSRLSLVILSASVALTTACGGPRVVVVPAGELVQLAESVRARVYVTLEDGSVVEGSNRVTIPEGWWAGPDPDPDE